MSEQLKPFAYVAFKGDEWTGSCAPEIAGEWARKQIEAGCTVKPVFSRPEYDAEMAKLK